METLPIQTLVMFLKDCMDIIKRQGTMRNQPIPICSTMQSDISLAQRTGVMDLNPLRRLVRNSPRICLTLAKNTSPWGMGTMVAMQSSSLHGSKAPHTTLALAGLFSTSIGWKPWGRKGLGSYGKFAIAAAELRRGGRSCRWREEVDLLHSTHDTGR